MTDAVRQKLIEVARAGGLITYSELARVPGLDAGRKEDLEELGRALADIANHETANGRPLLPIVLV
jgi:hypothetical protein